MHDEQPIWLGLEQGGKPDPVSEFVTRHCDFFLDGQKLPRRLIHTVNETTGEVLLFIEREVRGHLTSFYRDPDTQHPQLELRRGALRVCLREDARDEARRAYAALTRDAKEEARAILDRYQERRRLEDEEAG